MLYIGRSCLQNAICSTARQQMCSTSGQAKQLVTKPHATWSWQTCWLSTQKCMIAQKQISRVALQPKRKTSQEWCARRHNVQQLWPMKDTRHGTPCTSAVYVHTWPSLAGNKLADGPSCRPPMLPEEKPLLYTNLQVPLSCAKPDSLSFLSFLSSSSPDSANRDGEVAGKTGSSLQEVLRDQSYIHEDMGIAKARAQLC